MGTITQAGKGLHAACQPSRLVQRGPHPLHNPLNTHFHPQSLQLITVIVLPMLSFCCGVVILLFQPYVHNVSVYWQASLAELESAVSGFSSRCTHKHTYTCICKVSCESNHLTKLGSRHGVYFNCNMQCEADAVSHVKSERKMSLCSVNSAAMALLSAQPVSTKGVLRWE